MYIAIGLIALLVEMIIACILIMLGILFLFVSCNLMIGYFTI